MCLTETRFPRGSVRAGRDHDRVRTRATHPGDLVLVSKRGRLFYARVLGAGATGGLAGRRGLSLDPPKCTYGMTR
jgi:hypothetical protein